MSEQFTKEREMLVKEEAWGSSKIHLFTNHMQFCDVRSDLALFTFFAVLTVKRKEEKTFP